MNIEISDFNGLYNTRAYRYVEDDLYSIAKRVREIDLGYFILRNRSSGKYEVHHMGQPPGETFCITVPFDQLDQRTLDLIRETRIERLRELITKMHAENEKIDRDRDEYFRDYLKWIGAETYRYVCAHESKETLDPGAVKTRWV